MDRANLGAEDPDPVFIRGPAVLPEALRPWSTLAGNVPRTPRRSVHGPAADAGPDAMRPLNLLRDPAQIADTASGDSQACRIAAYCRSALDYTGRPDGAPRLTIKVCPGVLGSRARESVAEDSRFEEPCSIPSRFFPAARTSHRS